KKRRTIRQRNIVSPNQAGRVRHRMLFSKIIYTQFDGFSRTVKEVQLPVPHTLFDTGENILYISCEFISPPLSVSCTGSLPMLEISVTAI
ncbi:MAG: hypothetical protein AABZ61_05955, partial [Bacteroidota bacterium]